MLCRWPSHAGLSMAAFALLAAILVGGQDAAPTTSTTVTATMTAPTERAPTPTGAEKAIAGTAETPAQSPSEAPAHTPETPATPTTDAKPTPTISPTPTVADPTPHPEDQGPTQDDDYSSAFCSNSFWSFASVQDVLDELERGADLAKVNEDGMAPLHMAAQFATPERLSNCCWITARMSTPGCVLMTTIATRLPCTWL